MAGDPKSQHLTELLTYCNIEVTRLSVLHSIDVQDSYVTLLLLAINSLKQIGYPEGNLALLAAAMVYDQPLPTFN